MGIGDLKKSGDVFAGAAIPPGQSLGSVVQDPGFGDFDVAREEASEEKDTAMGAVLANPYLSPSGGKPLKKKSSKKPFVNDTPYTYKSLSLLAWLATVATAINILIGLGAIGYRLFGNFEVAPDEEGIMAFLVGIALVLLIFALSWLLSTIMTMIFMYRANANARSLGARELANSPWWCVFGWIIPFLNLVLPFLAMSEIARAARKPRGKGWQSLSTPGLVTGWWACLIIGVIAQRVSDRLLKYEIISSSNNSIIWMVSFGLIAIANIFLILTIWDITKRQNENAEKAGVT